MIKIGFGKDGKGEIIREARSQALSTLQAGGGIIIGTKLATTEDFRIIRTDVQSSITGLTSSEGKGLALYLVDGVFTIAEFEAAIEANGPLGPNEAVAAEIAMRFERWLGEVVDAAGTAGDAIIRNEKGGALLQDTIRWTFSRTKSWNWVLFNHGVALTTGATVFIKAKNYGVWVR